MRVGRSSQARTAGMVHGVITLIAYAVGTAWFIEIDFPEVRLSFIIIWFYAVLAGAAATAYAVRSEVA